MRRRLSGRSIRKKFVRNNIQKKIDEHDDQRTKINAAHIAHLELHTY